MSIDRLEEELVAAVAAETGVKAEMARFFVRPMLAHLRRTRGGGEIYIRESRARRNYPVDRIATFYELTRNVEQTCAEFSISRAQLFRLLKAVRKGRKTG